MRTDAGKSFYEFVMGCEINTRKNFKNPFYKDTKPALSFMLKDGQYFFKDFGDDSYHGDVFNFAGHYYGLEPRTRLSEIIQKMAADLNLVMPSSNRSNGKTSDNKVSQQPEKPNFKVSTDLERFEFWYRYGYQEQMDRALARYGVMAWESFERPQHTITNKDYPIFAIPAGNAYKIYQPGHPQFKGSWYPKGAKDTDVFGLDQLPDKGERVLIVEGPKDMIVAAAHGFKVVALDNAGTVLGADIISNLIQRFNQVILCLDNDSRGVEAMQNLSHKYQLPYLVLPSEVKIGDNNHREWGTDVADFFKAAGGVFEPWIQYLNNLLDNELIAPETPEPETEPVFWEINRDSKGKAEIRIKRVEFLEYLEWHGFRTLVHQGAKMYVRMIQTNVISEVDLVDIKHFLLDQTDAFGDQLPGNSAIKSKSLKEKLLTGAHVYFSESNISSLKPEVFCPVQSNEPIANFPFRNGIVQVTADSIKLLSFKECNQHVWCSQIIDRDFTPLAEKEFADFSFYTFLKNITGNDQNRLETIISYIGFMLHPYRDPIKPQLLVLYDQQISDHPEGGTGKGILSQALGQIKSAVYLDGKNFKFDNQFCWQRIGLDTQLVVFQDVTKWFKFDRLHSILTDGISVNKKNKKEFYIPYSESPKFLINTNFVLDAEGATNERRMKEIEFSPYYSPTFTPQDEFDELFFHSWKEEKWCRFDNLMMWCVQQYLKQGFVDSPSIAKNKRLFLQKYGEDVLEWIEKLPTGEKLRKRETFKKFKAELGDILPKNVTSKGFYAAMKSIYKASDVISGVEEDRDSQSTYFILQKNASDVHQCRNESPDSTPDSSGLPF